jgi:D-3-phosphoglycerate dehydrogenase
MLVAIAPSSFADADPQPLEWLRAAGVEIKPNPFRRRLTEAEITAHLEGVDGLLAGLEPLNRRVLASAGRLKALARVGIGMENVDLAAAAELGIKVSNTPEGPTAAVAEMTLGAALALLRDLPGRNAAVHRREWPKDVVWGLAGLPVLIVGYGRIGRRTAGLLQTLGARILVSDPKVRPEQLAPGEELVSLPEGLRRARMVSLHASGEREILGAAELELLPPGAYLLNSARGGLVNEAAVVAALAAGRLAGVWFDSFWQEPYRGALCDHPRALLTPHAATYTVQCRRAMETEAVQNLLRDLGIPPAGPAALV